MTPDAVTRAERLVGSAAETWARVMRVGYSKNEHWTIEFADGTRAFVKTGRIEPSPQWLRDEAAVLQEIDAPFAPRLVAFEDGAAPLLVLEELMPARWPPPWHDGDVELVLGALAEVAAERIDVPRVEDILANGWRRIEADPAPFLSTGLRDAAWLEGTLPALIDAADASPSSGDALLHCDVRSDNLCVKDGRVVLVDWNHARLGNPKIDVAFWLPSHMLERGSPDPTRFGVDEFAALVAGFFAAGAGLPPPAGAPTVREFQRAQAQVALDWTERVL